MGGRDPQGRLEGGASKSCSIALGGGRALPSMALLGAFPLCVCVCVCVCLCVPITLPVPEQHSPSDLNAWWWGTPLYPSLQHWGDPCCPGSGAQDSAWGPALLMAHSEGLSCKSAQDRWDGAGTLWGEETGTRKLLSCDICTKPSDFFLQGNNIGSRGAWWCVCATAVAGRALGMSVAGLHHLLCRAPEFLF